MSETPGQGPLLLTGRIGRVAAPLREQVLAALREAILSFQLKPGQRLIERELIEMTGVSRTTVREVLRELAAEGLVRSIPQRGAVVVVPSAEEAAELYDVRMALESHLVTRFVERASAQQVDALERAVAELAADTAAADDPVAWIRLEDHVYDVLGRAVGNDTLLTQLTQLHARAGWLRAASLSAAPGRRDEVVEELRAVVDRVRSGDAAGASAAVVRHLEAACAAAVTGLAAIEQGQ
jgi:DNA-binding GntR family transcriptional regulator